MVVTDALLTSMFVRCGGGDTSSSKKGSEGVGAVVDAVQQLGVAMKTSSSGSSPAKVIDSRSKCYKQLGELKSLKDSDLLSEEEYVRERQAIMNILGSL